MGDPIPTPTDPILETLAMLTPPQIEPQPHITESTTNETTINYSNQEQTSTWTQPTIEPPSESSPTPFNVHRAIADPHREYQQDPIGKTEKPTHWNQMSAKAKTNWRKRNSK